MRRGEPERQPRGVRVRQWNRVANTIPSRRPRTAEKTTSQIADEGHLDHVLRRYAEHYNAQRPHRGLELRTPAGVAPREFVPDVQRVRRIDVLGGLICEYESVAA